MLKYLNLKCNNGISETCTSLFVQKSWIFVRETQAKTLKDGFLEIPDSIKIIESQLIRIAFSYRFVTLYALNPALIKLKHKTQSANIKTEQLQSSQAVL